MFCLSWPQTLWLVTVQLSSSPTTSHILDVMCSFCKFLKDKKNTQSIVNNKTTLKHSHLIMESNPGPLALATSALATELRQPMSSKNYWTDYQLCVIRTPFCCWPEHLLLWSGAVISGLKIKIFHILPFSLDHFKWESFKSSYDEGQNLIIVTIKLIQNPIKEMKLVNN